MAVKATFTVKTGEHTGHVVEWMSPEEIDDKVWEQRIAGDHSQVSTVKVSRAVLAGVLDLARQSLVIKIQGAARTALPQGKAAVQAKVTGYCYGAKAAPSKPTVDAKELGLSKVQAEALAASGVVVLNMPVK